MVVAHDLSKAEELRPYRALDPSRLILLWDPSPYLSDRLWLANQEPASLLWTLARTEDSPDLEKESLDHTCELARIWDARVRDQPHGESTMHFSTRFFDNYKNPTTDRMIGDRATEAHRAFLLQGGLFPGGRCFRGVRMSLVAWS